MVKGMGSRGELVGLPTDYAGITTLEMGVTTEETETADTPSRSGKHTQMLMPS